MVLAPTLEVQLQTARLEALLPVLKELGVECCEDVEFLEEKDIEKRDDLTVIHKRRFLEWRAKLMDISSTASTESITAARFSGEKMQRQHSGMTAEKRCMSPQPAPQSPASSQGYPVSSSGNFSTRIPMPVVSARGQPMSSRMCMSHVPSAQSMSHVPSPTTDCDGLPLQTPRSRAMPLVHVLRELEALDVALKDERIRCEAFEMELHEEHEKNATMTEQLHDERELSKRLVEELERLRNATASEEVQEERKRSEEFMEELRQEREHSKRLAEELERAHSTGTTEELQEERKLREKIAEELRLERVKSEKMAEELERLRNAGTAEELKEARKYSARITEELQEERNKRIADELDKIRTTGLELEMQEVRKVSAKADKELAVERKRSAKISEELEAEREHSKTTAAELAKAREGGITMEELQEERNQCARIAEEKKANEEIHSRDIAMLEEMLEQLMTENKQLKASTNQSRPTTPVQCIGNQSLRSMSPMPDLPKSRSPMPGAMPPMPDFSQPRDSVEPRNSALYEPVARPSAIPYEPEMEPRRTLADRLSGGTVRPLTGLGGFSPQMSPSRGREVVRAVSVRVPPPSR